MVLLLLLLLLVVLLVLLLLLLVLLVLLLLLLVLLLLLLLLVVLLLLLLQLLLLLVTLLTICPKELSPCQGNGLWWIFRQQRQSFLHFFSKHSSSCIQRGWALDQPVLYIMFSLTTARTCWWYILIEGVLVGLKRQVFPASDPGQQCLMINLA